MRGCIVCQRGFLALDVRATRLTAATTLEVVGLSAGDWSKGHDDPFPFPQTPSASLIHPARASQNGLLPHTPPSLEAHAHFRSLPCLTA